MSERTSYAHGTHCWVDLVAHDMDAAMKWYGNLFGWDVSKEDTQGGPPYAMLRTLTPPPKKSQKPEAS